jgi:ABC-2 type transport system ATP-binding protein
MKQSNNSRAASSQSRILTAEELRKSYGRRPALQGLSFSLQAGRVLGLLGPNGAGKTTAIRILTTILEPSSGRFFLDGISSRYPEKIRSRIGVLPETMGFPKHLTGIEFLTFFGKLYGRTAAEAEAYGLALLEEVGLQQRAKSLIGSYSRGMRQRLGVARTLVNDPVVVFLDEPTLGLDPRGQQELLSLVRIMARERKVGVILCSHFLSEIETVCDEVVILRSGHVVATGSVSEVIGQARQSVSQRNVIRIQVPTPSIVEAQRVLEALPNIIKVTPKADTDNWLEVALMDSNSENSSGEHHLGNKILDALIRANIAILSYAAGGNRLQEVFLQLTEEGNE